MHGTLKVIKGSMMVLKTEHTTNLYKVIESIVIGDVSVATPKEDTTRLSHMYLGHMSERDLRALHNKRVLVLNTAKLTYISFAL